jgi:thiamine-monophosphate kinase
MVGEFSFIEKLRRRAGEYASLSLGIGDDCSVLRVPLGHELLTSTDLLLENVHFRLDWTIPQNLGYKAVSVNVSDLAAMGGRPLALYLGLGVPHAFSASQLDLFVDGLFEGLADYGICLAGGDTCRSASGLMLAVTVQGHCRAGQALTRAGGRAGDDLWVSGTLGDSALCLRHLMAGQQCSEALKARHFRPLARLALGQALAEEALATALLDLSDGLDGDIGHLLRASGVGARIELNHLPLSPDFRAHLTRRPDLIDLALCGGEDYELLFSANPQKRADLERLSQRMQLPLTRIGRLNAEPGLQYLHADGSDYRPTTRAFDHFAD